MTLLQRIEDQEGILDVIGRRLGALEEFLAELERVTHRKEFRVRNEVQWLLLLDSRDILVVHLASWAKSLYERCGLLGQVQAHHLGDLPRELSPPEPDPYIRQERQDAHAEAFTRLFPNATGNHPKPADVEDLKDRFAARMTPVIKDRHANRAHPFERKKGSATMLEVTTLRELYTYSTRMMNDLRLVGCDSGFGYPEGSFDQAAAADIVEALLFGTFLRIRAVRGDTPRDDYYRVLHARHDALPNSSAVMFNDMRDDDAASPRHANGGAP